MAGSNDVKGSLMGGKILVIGTYSSQEVDSFNWWQELPNLSDYGTIIIDTTKILHFWNMAGRLKLAESGNRRKFTPAAGLVPEAALPRLEQYVLSNVNQQDKMVKSNMDIIKLKLVEMLEFDFNVYVLFSPSVEITCEKGIAVEGARDLIPVAGTSARFIVTNDWCPVFLQTIAETGRTLRLNDKSYEDYFKTFNAWKFRFVSESLGIDEVENYYNGKWKVVPCLKAIATNSLNKPIAVEFTAGFHRWAHDEDEPEGGWHSIPEKYGARLMLLPTPDEYHTESSIELLLKRGKEFEETSPPTWVSGIEIPGEASLKNEIGTEKRQLEAIASKISELEGLLHELQKFKGLLYGTGLTLQELVRETLGKLGVGIEPSVVTDEFIINVSGRRALVEVKGNTKSISKSDLAQLITDLGEHLKATDEEVNGILIGNAWRLLPLEQRGTGDKPIFPKNVIKIAENHNIGLISTAELFKAYCKVLGNAQHREDVIDKIISKKGVISL